MTSYFVKPFDVLFFRGNKSFDLGEWYSGGIFPPLPSTFQGFVRTSILKKAALIKDNGELKDMQQAEAIVGNDSSIPFDLTGPFVYDGEIYVQTPLDLLYENSRLKLPDLSNETYLNDLSFKLHTLNLQGKAYWGRDKACLLPNNTFARYRLGNSPLDIFPSPVEIEDHVGITLDYGEAPKRNKRAVDNRFYMTPYRRLKDSSRLLFSTSCSEDLDNLSGKLGSESRGAQMRKTGNDISFKMANAFYEEIVSSEKGRFKLVLLQPGVFKSGWLPFPGKIINDEMILDYAGLKLKLLYARTTKNLRISGFSFRNLKLNDESKRGIGLKPMLNAVPAGAVYYFEIQNPSSSTATTLKSLDDSKLSNVPYSQMGFNHVILAKII
jgi:CRISPR/Cas system CMR-associated protein Cmr3 (group 5 of RAMP superfamily)